MKTKKELLIISILIFTILFIYPIKTNAKTYYISNDAYWSWKYPLDILEPGDVLDFSNCYDSFKYTLFLDGEEITGCYGKPSECNLQYTVKDRIVYGFYRYPNRRPVELYFNSMSDNQELLVYNDSTPDGYYKSGDVIAFYTEQPANVMAFYIYDEKDNLIFSIPYLSSRPPTYKLPKINGKDVYWKMESFVTPGAYFSGSCPHFTPFEYKEPKIELKCDKDKIKFGEKAKCEVCLECTHVLSKLEFSMNQKDLKFSNYSFSNGIINSGNNDSIKLNITDNDICNGKKTIMTFDVESLKDVNYMDTISLRDVVYTDEILTGSYKNLDSKLNITSVKNSISNPKTGTKLLFVLMPIIMLVMVATISVFKFKKKATN